MSKTIKELMNGHTSAEIRCMYRGEVVRRLTVNGNMLHLDAITESIELPLDTELTLQPWVMDRGSVMFNYPEHGWLKFCGEFDPITFEDGTEEYVSLSACN